MATAVTVIFGANSTQFQAELAKMQSMAVSSAARIRSATAAGGHPAGMTGMVRESTVIGREIAMGRGMGRILGSLTLLTQYIGTASRAAKAGVSPASELAAAWEKQALAANQSAIAAMKKAEALAVEAEMEGFETEATIAAADAAAAEAVTAQAAAAALRQKAAAAAADAAAQDALSASTATAGLGIMGLIGIFGLMVIIIAEAYVVFRGLVEIMGRASKMQLEAAEYVRAHTLAIWEEVEALEKLKDATEKTQLAIQRMNVEKDHSVELAKQAMEAARAEAEAKSKLYEAQEKSRLLELGIAHKVGGLSDLEYINRKADIEKRAISDKSKAKQDELDDQAKIAASAANVADQERNAAQAKAQAASDVINKSPEGQKRALALAKAEKDAAAAKSEAEQAEKDRVEYNKGGSNILWSSSLKARMEGFNGVADKSAALNETAESKANAAASAEMRLNAIKRLMSPEEKAAAEAMRIAQEKTDAATNLGLTAKEAATSADTHRQYAGRQVAAEQRNVELERMQEVLDTVKIGKGYEINSQQKVGAYSAAPPEFKQMVNYLQQIAASTQSLRPQNSAPPTPKGPQFGTRPNS